MKNFLKSTLMWGAILFGLAMCLTSCEGTLDDVFGEWSRPTGNNNDNTKISVTSIELDKETLELAVGDADVTLTATVKPDDATDKTVTWSSDNEDAATVADGVVHAVAVGTAIITAKAGDKSATCEVTVAPGLSTPLTLEVLTAGTIVIQNPKAGMQYSTDGGVTKNAVASGASVTINDGNDFNVGDKVEFYGDGTNITAYSNTVITTQIKGGTANFKVYGNIMSLVDETGFATATTLAATSTFYQFFEGSTQVIDASGLILPVTVYNCYSEMFKHCTNLTKAPKELPAETLAMCCYSGMFEGCSQLTTTPKLPAETLAQQCYQAMFYGCTNLTNAYVKAAFKTGSPYYECDHMFYGCTAPGAVIHTTSANKTSWTTAITNEGWTTWTAQDDWTD
jgi:hypothetical protein